MVYPPAVLIFLAFGVTELISWAASGGEFAAGIPRGYFLITIFVTSAECPCRC